MAETAIVRDIKNNNWYRHLHGDLYKNLHTQKKGEIIPIVATKRLRISVEMTLFLNKWPHIEELMFTKQLRFTVEKIN